MPRTWIVAAALLLAAGMAVAGEGKHRRGHGRGHGRGRKAGALVARERIDRALQRLDALTDEQAKAALDAATDLGRIREEARGRAAAVRLQAFREAKASPERREAIREATRAKVKALREEFRAPVVEAGMKVVRTLTPEQRAAMVRDGKTPTDERLALRFGKRLSRPGARAFLRARVEAGATTPPK